MKISKQELIKMGACESGYKRFIKQTKGTDEPVFISSLIGGFNKKSDFLWLAGKILNDEKITRFACDCALLNIHEIKPYTDKYDVIVDLLKNQSQAEEFIFSEIGSIDFKIKENQFSSKAYGAVKAVWYAAQCIAIASNCKRESCCCLYAGYASANIDIDNVNRLLKNLFSGD